MIEEAGMVTTQRAGFIPSELIGVQSERWCELHTDVKGATVCDPWRRT